MRQLIAIGTGVMLGLAAGRSQSLNIATWMVELPDANPTNRAAEFDPVLRRTAGVLKPLNADIVLLHGLPDRAAARQLIGFLRPRVYHNPLHSAFRRNTQSPEIVEPPITLLSRKLPAASRTMEWRATGQIDSPGGFSFAVFHFGTNTLFLCTAQFPKVTAGMTPQQEASVPRKRELSARYLVAHLNWLTETGTNAARFAYLATDIELDDSAAGNDPALAVLTANGFKAGTGSRTLVASTASSNTGWPPEGALISAFVRGTDFPGDPESISRKTFFAPVALVELDLIAPPPPPPPPPPSSVAATSSPNAANAANPANPIAASAWSELSGWFLARKDPRTLAIGSGIAVAVLAVFALCLRSRRRRTRPRVPVGAGPALTSGMASGLPSSERMFLPRDRSGSFKVLENPGRPSEREGEGPASREHEREHEHDSEPPKGTFFHLLRERLVRWLADERSQLLSSHHAGARQVLELEERLTKIQNQFESRLRAREQRISELEAELMAKEKLVTGLDQASAHDPRSPLA